MPLDMLITGRIATLAGDAGFGWVEAIGIRDGRIAFAGTEVYLETRADPFTERIQLEPDQVAIPGLTDAHLHLAQAAMATRQVDLEDAPTLDEGLRRLRDAHQRLPEGAWLEGHGWDSDRWGRWPTAADLEAVAPGRRAALWAHDHHALWASHAALREANLPAADPDGSVIRRAPDGSAEGVLYEAATRLVTVQVAPPSADDLERALIEVGQDIVSLGVVACHDPGGVAPDPDLAYSFPVYARLSDAGRLPLRVHACMRDDAVPAAIERGYRSGASLGSNPDGRATVGWQKCFADGSLGSRSAALLEDIEPEPDRPLPPERRRGVWVNDAAALRERVERAAGGGIATMIHAIGDAAIRAALDVLTPFAATSPLMPRIEHVQMLHPDDRPRFAAAGIAASVQPSHLGSDAITARKLWGDRAEAEGYTWKAIADTGAVMPFGTDAPVESYDPWPGLALAVRRDDPRWPSGTPTYAPEQSLTLDRALRANCIDAAVSARETDRGRLTVGQRADVVVIPAASLDEPVTAGGALSTTRPQIVLMDGKVVFEI
ncbi:MAG TPA: amidohydrolase [Candidatus Limnocylindrales bacterium]|nr:amidohydrolase [Candidatus Limnocylindrales bacterium]